MLTKTKDERGCWKYSTGKAAPKKTAPALAPPPAVLDVPDVPVEALDLDNIVKTISSMKSWLETDPSADDVEFVAEYETANANRTSAVGVNGCLTLYLEGE
jgi:hypothetical protein